MLNGVRPSGIINSPKNIRIRRYRRLRKRNFRYREGIFLVEGFQAVIESLYNSQKPECLICNQKGIEAMEAFTEVIEERSIPCYTVEDEILAALSTTVTPQGMIAVSPLLHVQLDQLMKGTTSTILMANRVRDPGNLGNMVRVADAAGAAGMVICRECVDLYNPKTVRSTAGSIFHVPLSIGDGIRENIQRLKQAGYTILAADAHCGANMWEVGWPDKLALVMGNEAWGIPEEEEALSDGLVRVPVLGRAESLNVSVAAALLLYEVQRRRARDKHGED